MAFNLRIMLFLLATVFVLTGCYNKPVRHLASDAALLKIGESSSEDVLIYLGDPDEQKNLADGVEKWLYKKKDMNFFERIPYAGKYIGAPEYSQVVVTIANGVVTDCTFYQSDEDDLDWADDYSWQEKKK
ncbi:MAG: hypothetical protein JRC69_00185 [Deltaproteobacteria bacterium]|nr:hypothetical protein [Deltaproteobacteria bacterium]